MIPKAMIDAGNAGSTIREIAEHGARREREIGAENVFSFAIGNPSAEPPACVRETIERLLREMDPAELHAYTPAPGLEPVRAAVAEYLQRTFGVAFRPDGIYMTSGSSSALAIVCRALLLPGEEALTLTPYFPEYRVYAESPGGVLVEVPSDPATFQMDLAAVERAVSPRTKLLLLNSPNNPSGVILSRESLIALARMLEEKQRVYGHAIYIVADEPYRELVYGGEEVTFIPALYRNTLYCYSFSKTLSLPGERIGYIALAPEAADYADVRAAVFGAARVLGYICAPPLFQYVVAECLGRTADLSVYAENRELLYTALTKMGYACVRPDGAFYLFVRALESDARAFCRRAMEHELLFVPGDDFGTPGYVRIAYCVPTERIRRALPAFRALAASYGK